MNELETELEFPTVPLGDSLSLVLTEKALFDRFKFLEERASALTETFNSLRNEEEQLATRLGEPTAVILYKHAPNQQQMRSLKTNIDYLTMEKVSFRSFPLILLPSVLVWYTCRSCAMI